MTNRIYYILLVLMMLAPPAAQATSKAPAKDDSLFADNVLWKLNEADRNYYNRFFVWAMESAPANKPQAWKGTAAEGAVNAGDPFNSGRGARCRRFSETATVAGRTQNKTGTACKTRDGTTWCKLRATSEPTCELLRPDGLDGHMLDLKVGVQNGKTTIERMMNWSPF